MSFRDTKTTETPVPTDSFGQATRREFLQHERGVTQLKPAPVDFAVGRIILVAFGNTLRGATGLPSTNRGIAHPWGGAGDKENDFGIPRNRTSTFTFIRPKRSVPTLQLTPYIEGRGSGSLGVYL